MEDFPVLRVPFAEARMFPRQLLADDLRRGLCLLEGGHSRRQPRDQSELGLCPIPQRAVPERTGSIGIQKSR